MARLQSLKGPVIVTGAAGFIGRRLVARLLAENVGVVAYDIVSCPESLCECDGLTWQRADICDSDALAKAMEQVNTVFHLAAKVGDWGAEAEHQKITVDGTRACFDAALANRCRVILASSIVVYGTQLRDQRCNEALPHGEACGPYSRAKQQQELLAQQFAQRGLDVRIVRPANVYGAGSGPWVEQLGAELQRGVPALIDGGRFDAGLVHVDNLVDILIRAARLSHANGQIFNAADEEGITWHTYMHDIAAVFGASVPRSLPRVLAEPVALAGEMALRLLRVSRRPPLTREALNLVGSHHRICMNKTREQLRYRPLVVYRDGLAEIQACYASG